MSELRDGEPPVLDRPEVSDRPDGYDGDAAPVRDAELIPGPRQSRSAEGKARSEGAEGTPVAERGAAPDAESVPVARGEDISSAEPAPVSVPELGPAEREDRAPAPREAQADGLAALDGQAGDRPSQHDATLGDGGEDPGAAGRVAERGEEPEAGKERSDIRQRYPDDYVPSADPPPKADRPHESPEAWAGDVNPDKDGYGRDNNCGECARAAESTWEGEPATAAAMSSDHAEPVPRMAEWAGKEPRQATMDEIGQRLQGLGPGSSAIVGCDWHDSNDGHWFNAINDNGTVKAVDGQSGLVEPWPPSDSGLGYSEKDMKYSDAIYFDSEGRVAR